MFHNNKIALCIPAYNAAKYISVLLNSAKEQNPPFDEIFVYNDCSTDNTEEIALQCGATVINGDINRGCSFGKNKLAEIVNSDWIHFHDADDNLYPNFTKLAHTWINKEDCPDVVLFDYEYRKEDNTLISVRHFNSEALKKDSIAYAIEEQINPFCGLYHKKKFLNAGGYDLDPKVLYNEDSAMHIRLAINGLSFASESEISIINYQIGNSMSASNRAKCILAQFEVQKKTITALSSKNQLENYKDIIVKKLWGLSTLLASTKYWQEMNACINLALELRPSYRPKLGNPFFNKLIKISPILSMRLREYIIRTIKPGLR